MLLTVFFHKLQGCAERSLDQCSSPSQDSEKTLISARHPLSRSATEYPRRWPSQRFPLWFQPSHLPMRSEVDDHFVKASCGDSAAQTPLTEGQIGSWGQMPFQKSRNVAHRLLRLRDAVVPFKNMPQPLPDLQINLYTAFSKAA